MLDSPTKRGKIARGKPAAGFQTRLMTPAISTGHLGAFTAWGVRLCLYAWITTLGTNVQANWHFRNPQPIGGVVSMAVGQGLLVALGSCGGIITSADTVTWTVRRDGNLQDSYSAIAFGYDRFVAVGWSGFLVSTDGLNWLARTDARQTFNSITFGQGIFVAVGRLGAIAVSSNGLDWTRLPALNGRSLRNVTYGNGKFICVGEAGTVQTSTDGYNWVSQTSGTSITLNPSKSQAFFLASQVVSPIAKSFNLA